ncbi:MAG: TIM barrel protein [Solirubrobacteraceae bacterium]
MRSEEQPGGASQLAGAPISWGVCEVPGWGRQLAAERVLGEMSALGLGATEIGPAGWLPTDPGALRELLARHELELVGGFVPFVLHTSDFEPARAEAERTARLYAAAGAEVLNAAVVADAAWSPPFPLDDGHWGRLLEHLARLQELVAAHGVRLAVHPHAGTLLEAAADVERLLADSELAVCFDSGHLLIGGFEPAAFARDHADRIAHVHLKDVDAAVAERLRAGELGLMEAVQAGLFRPLGDGDAAIVEVVRQLREGGYARWLVLEQDTAITGQEPPVGSGPVLDVGKSIEFLDTVAPTQEEVI